MADTYLLVNDRVRRNAVMAVQNAPEGYSVKISQGRRSLAQNRLMWQALTDVSTQVEWHGQFLTKEDWKDMFTASLRKSRVVPGIDPGSFVVTGLHTSIMTKSEMSSLMDLIFAFGSERGVVFSDADGSGG